MNTTLKTRLSATAAIAVLALSSAPAWAQEAQPVPTDPAPTVSTAPAPTTDSQPVAIDPAVPASTDTTEAPATTPPQIDTTIPVKTHRFVQKVSTPKIAQHSVRTTAPVAPAAPAVAASTAPSPVAAAPAKPAIRPIVDTTPKPAASAATGAKVASRHDNTALEFGGGAAVLVALGAGAFTLSRRRSDEEIVEEDAYEPVAASSPEPSPTPVPAFEEQPAILAPEVSAFSWGRPQLAEVAVDDGSDRRPGESWVDRAYRGPSPANPRCRSGTG